MKCVKYWPNTQTLLGPYQIRMERQNTSRRYILRHIKIKKVVVYFIYLLTILCKIFEKKLSMVTTQKYLRRVCINCSFWC